MPCFSRTSHSAGNRGARQSVSRVVATWRCAIGVLASSLLGAACGEVDVGESASTLQRALVDGEPDCGNGQPWISEGSIDPDAPGEPTAEEALRPFLEQWQELFGGDVAMVGADQAALTLDGAEVVVAYTTRTNPGGFAVDGSTGCDGFEPDVLPGASIPRQSQPGHGTAGDVEPGHRKCGASINHDARR